MKKSKTLLILSLIIALALILSGCSTKPQSTEERAKQLYQSAIDKMAELDCVHLKQELQIKASFFGMDIELPINIESKSIDLQTDNPFVVTHVQMSDTDFTSDMDYTVSSDNDYIYMIQEGLKIKISKDFDEYQEMSGLIDAFRMNPEDYKDSLQSIELAENSDKSSTIKAEVNPEEINNSLNKLIESYIDQIEDSIDLDTLKDVSLNISDAKVEITISPDGYFDHVVLNMNIALKMKIQGITMTLNAEISGTSEYIDLGKDLDIERPDPDDYIDYTDLMDLDLFDLDDDGNTLGPPIGT